MRIARNMKNMCVQSKRKKVDFSKEAIQRAYHLLEYVDHRDTTNYFLVHNKQPYPWPMFFQTIRVLEKEVVWLIRDHKFTQMHF